MRFHEVGTINTQLHNSVLIAHKIYEGKKPFLCVHSLKLFYICACLYVYVSKYTLLVSVQSGVNRFPASLFVNTTNLFTSFMVKQLDTCVSTLHSAYTAIVREIFQHKIEHIKNGFSLKSQEWEFRHNYVLYDQQHITISFYCRLNFEVKTNQNYHNVCWEYEVSRSIQVHVVKENSYFSYMSKERKVQHSKINQFTPKISILIKTTHFCNYKVQTDN